MQGYIDEVARIEASAIWITIFGISLLILIKIFQGILANSILESLKVSTPIVSIIIGEGGSGGAVALATADRVLMLENSIYSASRTSQTVRFASSGVV